MGFPGHRTSAPCTWPPSSVMLLGGNSGLVIRAWMAWFEHGGYPQWMAWKLWETIENCDGFWRHRIFEAVPGNLLPLPSVLTYLTLENDRSKSQEMPRRRSAPGHGHRHPRGGWSGSGVPFGMSCDGRRNVGTVGSWCREAAPTHCGSGQVAGPMELDAH